MDQTKRHETTEVKDEELKTVTKNYKKLNRTKRCFLVSASSMLLASQEASEKQENRTIREA